MSPGWFEASLRCLEITDPAQKCAAVEQVCNAAASGGLTRDDECPLNPMGAPGRPSRPRLVDPAAVARRRLGSEEGRAALVHAIAHIEFNAINLALDAVYRFRGMPDDYYLDWLSVAADEARHFLLLRDRLMHMGWDYGDFPAHNGLWEMAEKTAAHCLERMALVPRVLEARGLDVTPGMIDRLSRAGDHETVAALEIILSEEVRHVAIGSRWFRYCCERQGVEPLETFLALLGRYFGSELRGPFNLDARRSAGFSEEEINALTRGLSD